MPTTMTIPTSQLETWSRQGATDPAIRAHEAVRAAISKHANELTLGPDAYDIYIQGSYRNSTNIWRDSDVDVVVQMNSNATYRFDVVRLTLEEQQRCRAAQPAASYFLSNFRAEILSVLRKSFGVQAIQEGNKAVNIVAAPGRQTADVIICQEYRGYTSYNDGAKRFLPGIVFDTLNDGRQVVNFPKFHIENGQEKNGDGTTEGYYKPTVRIFKNARNAMIERGLIADGVAPSYFVECLLYNAPNELFTADIEETFIGVTNWAARRAQADSLWCQNGVIKLIGNSPEQWRLENASAFVNGLVRLYEGWR